MWVWRRNGLNGAAAGLMAMPLLACEPAPTAPAAPVAAPPPLAAPARAAPDAAARDGALAGEKGEAGVADSYAETRGAETALLRLQHLKGFLLVAEALIAAGGPLPDAGILVEQGLLEVADPAPQQLAGLDRTVFANTAALLNAGDANGTPALKTALAAIDAAQQRTGAPSDAALIRRMLRITAGLYAVVVVDGGVDPTEYQHALGAALSAQSAFAGASAAFERKDRVRTANAEAGFAALIAMWPGPVAPEAPLPPAKVLAQISRIELELSGLE